MIPLRTQAFLACRMLSHRSLVMHPPVRTATRLIYASLHASCIVERCHRRRRRMCSVAIVNSHEPPAPGHQLPVNDWPPACSMRNDMGKTSYRTLQNQTESSRLQKYVCNWLTDAKQIRVGLSLPELSIRTLLVSRVQKYTPIEQGAVNISNHTVKEVNHQLQSVC